ncbi:hypothetical protein ACKWTF_004978 [Chironomus riparius]
MEIHEPGIDYEDIDDMSTAYKILDNYLIKFMKHYNDYQNLKKDDVDLDSELFSTFKKQITSKHLGFKFLFIKIKAKSERQFDVTIRENEDRRHQVRKVKLPEIKLPEFDGSFDKWLTFRDTFVSLVHLIYKERTYISKHPQ